MEIAIPTAVDSLDEPVEQIRLNVAPYAAPDRVHTLVGQVSDRPADADGQRGLHDHRPENIGFHQLITHALTAGSTGLAYEANRFMSTAKLTRAARTLRH